MKSAIEKKHRTFLMNSYASIVPLIGGETFAMENVFGTRPE